MTPEQNLDLKRTVWAYMLEEGDVTEGGWTIYGGRYEPPEEFMSAAYDHRKRIKLKDKTLADIKAVGIDWDKTQMPESDTQSEFQGTFAKNTRVETLLGTLILKDEREIMFGVSGADKRFADYVKTVALYMDDKERVKRVFGE